MQFSLKMDHTGRYVCALAQDREHATVTASNIPEAGDDLLAGLEDARDSGLGESLWMEQGGEYRWMFRRVDDRLTLVVLWSSGTITGWQHVFRAEVGFDEFVAQARDAVRAVAAAVAR